MTNPNPSRLNAVLNRSSDALAATGMFLANSANTVVNTADKVVEASGDTTANVVKSTGKVVSNVAEIGANTTAIGSNAVKFLARGTEPESQKAHEAKKKKLKKKNHLQQ